MNLSCTSQPFKVHRSQPELIRPAKTTPHEFKPLSDIDDQDGLRFHIPMIQVYSHNPSMDGVDPVQLIRDAISKTLVFYYPFAGRSREDGPTRKLIVECNSEGVLFIEADADVTLHQFGSSFLPPCPYLEDLLFYVPDSSEVLNSPLLLIQITRFKCGGFILALSFNHTMSDGPGLVQFLKALGEIARGKEVPSILPVWERHVLSANDPPNPTCFHPEYENNLTVPLPLPLDDDLVQKALFFGPEHLSFLKKSVPTHMHPCSTFEILTAFMWKSRTISLVPNPTQIMRMICLVNVRKRFNPPMLPEGYYGNGFLLSTVISTAEDLIGNPLEYALGLIRKAKQNVNREYVQSAMDTLVSKGRPLFHVEGTYIMSDNRLGFGEVDYGWGNAVYGGPPRAFPTMSSFLVPYQNNNGENGIVVPLCLPIHAMERFIRDLNDMF